MNKFDFEIHEIRGIVGIVKAYFYDISYNRLIEYLDNVIDYNTKNYVYKVWDKDKNYNEIKTREDFNLFRGKYGRTNEE